MSKNPTAQQRLAVRNAQRDKAVSQRQLRDMKAGKGSFRDTKESRATFERHIAKQDQIIKDNS